MFKSICIEVNLRDYEIVVPSLVVIRVRTGNCPDVLGLTEAPNVRTLMINLYIAHMMHITTKGVWFFKYIYISVDRAKKGKMPKSGENAKFEERNEKSEKQENLTTPSIQGIGE